MRLQRLTAASLLAAIAQAFLDTSPFFAFSTSDALRNLQLNKTAHISPASKINTALSRLAVQCPSDTYILVSQPGLSAEDLAAREAMPMLGRDVKDSTICGGSSVSVANVMGNVDVEGIAERLRKGCGAVVEEVDYSSMARPKSQQVRIANRTTEGQISASRSTPALIKLDLPALPSSASERAAALKSFDTYLAELLSSLPTHSHTILYTSTPPIPPSLTSSSSSSSSSNTDPNSDSPLYTYDTPQDSLHIDLKRSLSPPITPNHNHVTTRASSANSTAPPLFERYNFLSPGIYMGLVAAFLLLPILYVGVSAVASIEVSYHAFSKEMGPGAQRKAQ
ncbi:MAG: hypothetical protein M1828_000074 [Chrysothrix sp. TS-e1954]|nr:MAG: hypothetical protein M1828_000074 [Chrysothrix sp. TS-e1954]